MQFFPGLNKAWRSVPNDGTRCTTRFERFVLLGGGPVDARLLNEQIGPNLGFPLPQPISYIERQWARAVDGVGRQHEYTLGIMCQCLNKSRPRRCGDQPGRHRVVVWPSPAALCQLAVQTVERKLQRLPPSVRTETAALIVKFANPIKQL